MKTLLAIVCLNGILSFENLWPTIAIKPDSRLAPEFVLLWLVLLALAAYQKRPLSSRWLRRLSVFYVLFVFGRYIDVTTPSIFGRSVNLYWDGTNFLIFLWVGAQKLPWWQTAGVLLAVAIVLYGFYRLIALMIKATAEHAIPWALNSKATLALSVAAALAIAANLAGVQATWPYVSKPVIPTYLKQGYLLVTAMSPERLAAALPESPKFDSDLKVLNRGDVKLLFLETYGAVTFDTPEFEKPLRASRQALANAISGSGRSVVSAFVKSPTFGGASELAHLSLLSGIDLSDPIRHDLLLTTDRPTLVSMFKQRGYTTIGLYPALSWDWPEKDYYGFDHFYDGRDLKYGGPKFGLWEIPDQYSMATFEQRHPRRNGDPPQFLVFPTINSHLPFRPLPPVQTDWKRLLSKDPFDEAATKIALADKLDWNVLREPFVRSIQYTYDWLADYLVKVAKSDDVLILIGDHQPAGKVSGRDATWDVPVHIVFANPTLKERLTKLGFAQGMVPNRPVLGAMNQLTERLIRAFDSGPIQ